MRYYPFIIIILVALSGFLAGYNLGQPDYIVGPHNGNAMRVEVWIYRNGELVYYDPDDPAVNNAVYFLAALFMANPPDVTALGGAVIDPEANDYYQFGEPGFILVSNDTSTFSRSMTTFQYYEMATFTDDAVALGANYIQISGSLTVAADMNITYVGLGTYVRPTVYPILLFADQLSQPIQVAAGDVVTVVYKIVLP